MNEKQQQLTFDKGITNVPSDALCSDNTLQESLGMVYDNGEHRVIQNPKEIMDDAPITILVVHKTGVSTNYIGYDSDGNLRWGTVVDGHFVKGNYDYYEIEVQDLDNWQTTPPLNMADYEHIWLKERVPDASGYHWYYSKRYGGENIRFRQSWDTLPHDNYQEGDEYFDRLESGIWTTSSFNSEIFGFAAPQYATDYLGKFDDTEKLSATVIGKTLIVNSGTKLKRFLWKEDDKKYFDKGEIQEPNISFTICGPNAGECEYSETVDCYHVGMSCIDNEVYFSDNKQADYNNLVIGTYAKLKKDISKAKLFYAPFMLRYAIELFDGSYTYQSVPVLMFPSITSNLKGVYHHDWNEERKLRVSVMGRPLALKASYDYSDWRDIIRGVSVFITDQIETYNTSGDQKITNMPFMSSDSICTVSTVSDQSSAYHSTTETQPYSDNDFPMLPLNRREEKEIVDDIASSSVFYKLFELPVKMSGEWETASKYIKDYTVENITTQEQLVDDYYSHCHLAASGMFSYNNRLLLSGVVRDFWNGASTFMPYYENQKRTYIIRIDINTDAGTRTVEKEVQTKEIFGIWFFYPDPRAYKATVYAENDGQRYGYLVKEIELKEHPYLNGAYFFEKLPDGKETNSTSEAVTPEALNNTPESMPNQVWVSEVNNPWLFKAEGNITVGNGTIIGISNLTQALSQGQFGQYPLIIFTDEGIWAASTGNTGLFTTVHPMSREVCNNRKSITQTDGAVFFSSEKGLMVVVGNDVRCVSEQLGGMSDLPFADYLKDAIIAYDYRDSLLWIFDNKKRDNVVGLKECYVYSIKSSTFARFDFGTANIVTNVVTDYPDYLLQSGSNIFSLIERCNINADTNTYSAVMKTRPMKLENALALKSIMQIRHVLQFSPYTVTETHEDPETHESVTTETTQKGSMTLRIFASNNLDNWVDNWAELHSLRGTPWKYYYFQYDFSNLKATDRFAGTMLITQERRTNKLR